MTLRTGGQLVVDHCLAAGIKHIFGVPGESYLPVMDALFDVRDRLALIACRHEGGAAMMAAATAQLHGRPQVAFVTRGPGATNASIAVHIAHQASIPLVLGVGQVARDKRGREAFQEVDFEDYFRPITKFVREVRSAVEIPAVMAAAFHAAASGRQGPAVVVFPEDVLAETALPAPSAEMPADAAVAIDDATLSAIETLLGDAARPVMIVGGGPWSDAARRGLHEFVAARRLPVFSAFRRADIFDNTDPAYAGFCGYGATDETWRLLAEADCVFALGTRLDEPTTRGYTCFDAEAPPAMIHIHPEPAQLGRHWPAAIAVTATVEGVMPVLARSVARPVPRVREAWLAQTSAAFGAATVSPAGTAALDPGAVMSIVNEQIGPDAIVTTDAGNFSVWPLRHRRYARPGRLLAPINGAMGYGVPAAVAASLAAPERTVLACVGDGGMLMTGAELATAMQYGARPIVLVFNNAKYGTIAMHQARRYPGRAIGNALANPDFAAYARSFGAFGARVESTDAFAETLAAARACPTAALIELVMDPDAPP